MKTFSIHLLLFLGLASIPLLSLLSSGLPLTHDGQDHVARIANFYKNLEEGTIIPRWGANLNWGYGHPVLQFLYPLPSYLASLFHFVGFSFVDSVKMVFGIAYVASGFTMYLWIKEIWGAKAGLLAGLLYIFAPYRFVDLYVRGAIGEHVAFVFPPLICYFLLQVAKNYRYRYFFGGSLSLAACILSHNAISLMFLPIIALYACYLAFQAKQWKVLLLQYVTMFVFGFSSSAFFWLPAFMEGKYTLRDIVTADDYASRFVPIKDFFYGVWSYGGTQLLSKQIGVVQWGFVIASIIHIFVTNKKKKHENLFIGILLAIFFCTLFIMTSYAKGIWDVGTILRKFQFPWRFLSITVFLSSVLGGYVFSRISAKKQAVCLGIFIIVLLFANKDYWYAKGYLQKPESFYTGIYDSTTDTGESAPIWSVRFMEQRPAKPVEVISGKATIQHISRKTTKRDYKVIAEEPSQIRENTLFFPGWHVLIDGKEAQIEFQDPHNRGVMTYMVEKGEHLITVVFTDTKLRLLANGLSLASLLILCAWGILEKKRLWHNFRLS